MKRFDEISTYTLQDDAFYEEESAKDKLIVKLEQIGHKVIPIGRAFVVVEQCEGGDDFPQGWSHNPLKISIYPDTDLAGEEPSELYIHAGRYGLHEVILKSAQKPLRYAEFLDTPKLNTQTSDNLKKNALNLLHEKLNPRTKIHRVLDTIREYPFDGQYAVKTSDDPYVPLEIKKDEKLSDYADELRRILNQMLERLDGLSAFNGNNDKK